MRPCELSTSTTSYSTILDVIFRAEHLSIILHSHFYRKRTSSFSFPLVCPINIDVLLIIYGIMSYFCGVCVPESRIAIQFNAKGGRNPQLLDPPT